ncbi:isochorismatase family protein [Halobellus sp. GM3]|uniref:isochorismatase family protein n=1 Tax=Halobellus sp. GM3 TaxID=3458410 RepID=UPI00403D7741
MNSKEDTYEESGIGTEQIGFGDTPAIVVIDLQKAFTDPDCPLGSNLDETVANTVELLKTARQLGIPVYFTRVVWRADYRDAGIFGIKGAPDGDHLTADSDFSDLDSRLPVDESDHILEKKQPSAFFGTELNTMLTTEGCDTVIVTGATTSGCVRATVVDACSYGYRPIVPRECVGDRAPDPHKSNLFDMNAKYADVLPLNEVTQQIQGG